MKCLDDTIQTRVPCENTSCRFYIKFQKDLNCTHVAIIKNGNMKLHDVGARLNITAARTKQIENETLKKINKRSSLLKILE